jgi:methylmalonyl-CoA/ethylmalonyl-CoA epimerase
MEALNHAGVNKPFLALGLGDFFTEQGDTAKLLSQQGLDAAGIALIHRHPKPGADGKIIAFLHPKATGGSLIELCQDL